MSNRFQPRAGRVLDGRYVLESEIGEGGHALVWRARHQRLGHSVAVKFLREPDDADRRARFLREAQVAAAIRHRNVVEILDVGEEDDHVYMVMELLEGESLAEHLARGPMTVSDAVRVIAAILGGLTAVHEAGIVHRDVKPENVLLVNDADGYYPKIVDFGISRVHMRESEMPPARQRDSGAAPLTSVVPTQENVLVGTPEYMSPEQVRAKTRVDHRSDVWSVGVMLYEMLTSDVPFRGETAADVFIAVATEQETPVRDLRPDVPEALARFLHRALRKAASERYTNARAMRRALVQAVGESAAELEALGPGAYESAQALRSALGASYEPGDSVVMKLPPVRGPRDDQPTRTLEAEASGEGDAVSTQKRATWVLAAVGVLALIGAGVFVVLGTREPEPVAEAAPAPAAEAAPTPAPIPASVRVELRPLPEGAEVWLNGRAQASGELEVSTDATHAIEVRAPEHETWRVERRFEANAELTPVMPRVQVVEEAPPPTARPERPRSETRPRGTRSTMRATTMSGLYRDPGF
ncbi:MAG: serine/threonine protein kinase [Sandaracinus sp.]|nr:serine/threonine protein kinase [Sandaracinus sp.]MCB9632419.1 serine/threonine protein kinase [Sandaracinus sp.]